MIKGIIFDLDGVIVHTDRFHYLSWKKLTDREGIYFDESINNLLRGVSRKESLEIILHNAKRDYSIDEKDEMLNYKNNIYREYLSTMSRDDVNAIVIDTLLKLKELGMKLAIGSSSKNAHFILEKTEIISVFDAISDGNNITKSKPDPEVFIKASQMLNLVPSECLVVEDAVAGIDAADSGGFKSVGLGDAYNYHKTDYPIKDLKELINIVKI